MPIRPLIKSHGGKWYLRSFIINNFPIDYQSMDYIEPCISGGSILLNKPPSLKETISDINFNLINLWLLVKNYSGDLQDNLSHIEYSIDSFNHFKNIPNNPIKEYALSRMSRGGLRKSFAYSKRLRGGKPGDENAWDNSINNIPLISERIKNVDIRCESLTESLLRTLNNTNTLIYADPPYLHSTRTTKSAYEFEMTEQDHSNFLDVVLAHKGRILISGYWSKLYEDKLHDWSIVKKTIVNHSSQQKRKKLKEEMLWKNY